MQKKQGITLTSLAIYLVLFTTFTAFTMSVSSNMNEKLFDNRGEAINYTNLVKLQTNIENSASQSSDVVVTSNTIQFSNGDLYSYNASDDIITKNGGMLCENISSFAASVENKTYSKKISISIQLNKYLNELNKEIISYVEVI